jgi:hypothetical protein
MYGRKGPYIVLSATDSWGVRLDETMKEARVFPSLLGAQIYIDDAFQNQWKHHDSLGHEQSHSCSCEMIEIAYICTVEVSGTLKPVWKFDGLADENGFAVGWLELYEGAWVRRYLMLGHPLHTESVSV